MLNDVPIRSAILKLQIENSIEQIMMKIIAFQGLEVIVLLVY